MMFSFLLPSFSVGLVIYWAWNNVLSLLQQYTIMRKNGAEIHLWRNMGVEGLIQRIRSGQGIGAGEALAKASAAVKRGADMLSQRLGGGAAATTAGGSSSPPATASEQSAT